MSIEIDAIHTNTSEMMSLFQYPIGKVMKVKIWSGIIYTWQARL